MSAKPQPKAALTPAANINNLLQTRRFAGPSHQSPSPYMSATAASKSQQIFRRPGNHTIPYRLFGVEAEPQRGNNYKSERRKLQITVDGKASGARLFLAWEDQHPASYPSNRLSQPPVLVLLNERNDGLEVIVSRAQTRQSYHLFYHFELVAEP